MPTLQEAVSVYLKLDLSPKTLDYYRRRLAEMVNYFDGDRPIESISYAEVVGYVYDFRHRLMESTYYQYQVVVKTFFKWCVEVDFIPTSPAARLKIHHPRPQPVDRAIPGGVLDAMYAHLQRRGWSLDIRDYAIIRFIDESACRRGGAASLQISQLHLGDMWATVKEKGRRYEEVSFGPETSAALLAWLEIRPGTEYDAVKRVYKNTLFHDYVFTARRPQDGYPPLQPEAISMMINRLSKKVGERSYGPHAIRHLTLEDMVRAGEPVNVVSDKANHLHRKTTQDYYYPPTDRQAVHEATLRRAARRKAAAQHAKIIPLFEEEQESI